MSETITEMTAEQEARIPEWIEKWIKIGLSTEPLDFEQAKQAAFELYQFAGFDKPKTILKVASPWQAVLQGYEICKSQVDSKVNSGVQAKIWSHLYSKMWLRINLQPWVQLRSQIWLQIYASVYTQIHAQIDHNILNSVYSLSSSAYSILDVAVVSFFRDVLNWQDTILENFEIIENLVIHCSYLWWHEDVLVISDRPEQIHLDNQGELHSESGPAISYRDGYSQWYWHGVAVSQLVIERPQDITVRMIDSEFNTEVRRIMIDRFGDQGIVSYLLASKNKILDHDERWGTLYYRDLQEDEPIVMVEVINRTPEADGSFKHYFLRVPFRIKTAHEAVAWTFGKVPGDKPISGQRRQGDVLIERYETGEYYPESES